VNFDNVTIGNTAFFGILWIHSHYPITISILKTPVMGYLVKPLKEAELHAMIEVATRRFSDHARTARDAADAVAALSDREIIDRAKGLLMQRDGVSELEAYSRIEQRARRERRTLLEAAEEIAREFDSPAHDRPQE
jgi:response regulator NasT